MEVVLIGRGAIGGAYCSALDAASGINLRVAALEDRVQRYSSEVYKFNGKELQLNYFTPSEESQKADLVIITTKWDGFKDALNLAAPLVGDKTVILPLLNGLLPYEVARDRFPEARVLAGYYIGVTAVRSGNSTTVNGDFKTCFGEIDNFGREGRYSEAKELVAQIFELSGLTYLIDEDMRLSQWRKFIINIGFNQVSALDGGLNYEQIRGNEELVELCRGLMHEAVDVALKVGVNIENRDEVVDKAMSALEWLNGGDYTSMAQDVLAGRKTEWEIFGKYLLSMAKDLNINLSLHTKLEERLKEKLDK